MGCVAVDAGRVFGEVELEDGFLGNGGAEEVGHFFDERGKVDGLDDKLPFAGVGEHLFGEFAGAHAGSLDLFEVAADG